MSSPNAPSDAPHVFTIDLEVVPVECLVQLHHLAADATLEVSGEIDLGTVHTLTDALTATAANGVQRLVVDLDGVGFIGACGLNALVTASAAHREAGKEMRIRTSVPSTRRLISLTGLDDLMVPV